MFPKRLQQLIRRRDGGLAMMYAIVGGVCALAMAVAYDYTMANQRNDLLQSYADAAALSATTPSAMALSAAGARASATLVWTSQAATASGVSSPAVTVTVVDSKPNQPGNIRTVQVSYTGGSINVFSQILGFDTLPLQGQADATMGSSPFINIYVLLDNSQSMGIASTQTDMDNLYNVTQAQNNDGCVFGCHVPLAGEPNSDETLAHQNGITLRIDAAKSAITQMISEAQTGNMSSRIQFALYTMGGGDSGSANLLKQVAPLSSNYNNLLSRISTIDLESGAQGVIGDTDIEDAATALQTQLPSSNGSGDSAASAINYIFIVTDGLDDSDINNSGLPCLNNAPAPGGYRCTQALNTTVCPALQSSANIGVIYTPYLPLYQNDNSADGFYISYTDLVQQYAGTISNNLQACASNPSLYFTASDGPGLVSAMSALFNQAINAPYITK